jgi:ferredoxin
VGRVPALWNSVKVWRQTVKIGVDWDQCEANGVCVGVAPDLFDLDDNDELHVFEGDVAADRVDDARAAIAQCPKAALNEQA